MSAIIKRKKELINFVLISCKEDETFFCINTRTIFFASCSSFTFTYLYFHFPSLHTLFTRNRFSRQFPLFSPLFWLSFITSFDMFSVKIAREKAFLFVGCVNLLIYSRCVICSRVRRHYKLARRFDSFARGWLLLFYNWHRMYLRDVPHFEVIVISENKWWDYKINY